jgi:hypothetical protein
MRHCGDSSGAATGRMLFSAGTQTPNGSSARPGKIDDIQAYIIQSLSKEFPTGSGKKQD